MCNCLPGYRICLVLRVNHKKLNRVLSVYIITTTQKDCAPPNNMYVLRVYIVMKNSVHLCTALMKLTLRRTLLPCMYCGYHNIIQGSSVEDYNPPHTQKDCAPPNNLFCSN